MTKYLMCLAFLETWRRSVKGWKAWEINDAFQDYDPNKSGHISLASFVSVLKEEVSLYSFCNSLKCAIKQVLPLC